MGVIRGDSSKDRVGTISLDYHATTPVAPEVVAAMIPFFSDTSWNAHSAHAGGAIAASAVAVARAQVADLVGSAPSEIVFTSGATEANNIAILGTAAAATHSGSIRRRILTSTIEHKCVLEAAGHLSSVGFVHELIPVTAEGLIDLAVLSEMLDEEVLLVSVMAASNEIGVIQPLAQIGELAGDYGAIFHVDAAQAVGRVPFDVFALRCDLASFSGHKMYGPNGIGALFVSSAAELKPRPIMFGGGQEQGLRPGTLAVPLIVGFGKSAAIAAERMEADARHLTEIAHLFVSNLRLLGIAARLNGAPSPRLPGSLNLLIDGVDADDVVLRLGDDLHLSTGSACQSGELQGSHVLRALGLSDQDVASSFRICFGREHTESDAIVAAKLLAEAVASCEKPTGGGVQQRGSDGGKVHGEGFSPAICGT